jgi:hypothetical protein
MPAAIAAKLIEKIPRWTMESRGFFANDFSALISNFCPE